MEFFFYASFTYCATSDKFNNFQLNRMIISDETVIREKLDSVKTVSMQFLKITVECFVFFFCASFIHILHLMHLHIFSSYGQ